MKEVRAVNRPKEKEGEFNLAKPNFGRYAHIDVYLCRDCRKMVIDY